MKQIRKKTLLIMLALTSFAMTQCTEYDSTSNVLAQDLSDNGSVVADTLSQEVKSAILFMREEEKLARDAYLTLYDTYPLRPFLNISKSEQAHMDAMLYLIELYGLDDPVKDNPIGLFENEELQALFDELIEIGSESRVEALKVGALIEEVDILDLEAALLEAGPGNEIERVYTNLLNASKNHLRAFVRVLGVNGVEYEPVKLDQKTYLTIIED